METITITGKRLECKKQLFITNRLSDITAFGRPDIEKWLANQKEAVLPDDGASYQSCLRNHQGSYKGWDFYLWRMFNSDIESTLVPNMTCIEMLREHGATLEKYRQKHSEEYPLVYKEDDLLMLLSTLAKNQVYCIRNGLIFDFGDPLGVFTFTIEPGDGDGRIWYSRSVYPLIWAQSVHMNWKHNLDEVSRLKTRDFLCDCLERRIQQEREKIEADFDAAVAVREDGSKIVPADKVVLFRIEEHAQTEMRIYLPIDFKEKKLLRGKEIGHTEIALQAGDDTSLEKKIAEAVFDLREFVASVSSKQVLAKFRGHIEPFTAFIFQISGAFPDGGVVVVP